jgi:hypothetical protein
VARLVTYNGSDPIGRILSTGSDFSCPLWSIECIDDKSRQREPGEPGKEGA